jgi:hypothetical protein
MKIDPERFDFFAIIVERCDYWMMSPAFELEGDRNVRMNITQGPESGDDYPAPCGIWHRGVQEPSDWPKVLACICQSPANTLKSLSLS